MSENDATLRPNVPVDDAPAESLVEPEGVNAVEPEARTADVRSGGNPEDAPERDDDRWAEVDQLVGAGPETSEEVAHGDSGQDAGYIPGD
ncbi:hypothetical protein [Georgenia wangjunii]|uniref:hypothetical protein n=1 Tax=Georgenia wangjunii TaxID=3117730 RepID=UPI002F26937E